MNNNKQVMKLYTEEHLKIFYHLGKIDGFVGRQDDVNELIKKYPSIELPSDEEIDKMWPLYYTEFGNGLNEGAKQMRDKIGGNNDQQ